MKKILLNGLELLLIICLITSCSANNNDCCCNIDGDGTENGGNGNGNGDGTENGGNGNGNGDGDGNGDGKEEEEDELEGYIQFDWDSFEYVFNSLNDLRIHKYRLPFKNVDAKPEDYEKWSKVDSVLYPGIIFGFVDDEIVPIDTNAYMAIYMESQQNSFYLTSGYFYEHGEALGADRHFYDGYKPKGVNFLYKSEDLWDYNLFPVLSIKSYTGDYYDINQVMSLGIKHLYRPISDYSTTHNSPNGKRIYFIENFTKVKE